MRIHEIADRTGLPRDTIRYWERLGLLSPQRSLNGYRSYGSEDFQRLMLIQLAKQCGFTLRELPAILDRAVGRRLTGRDLRRILLVQRERVSQRIRDLTVTRRRIDQMLRGCSKDGIVPAAKPGSPCRRLARS